MTQEAKGKRRRWPPGKAELKALIEEATVDAHDESEQRVGFYTMLENDLALPFETEVLGVSVTVEQVNLTDDERIVAVCRRGRSRQAGPPPVFDRARDARAAPLLDPRDHHPHFGSSITTSGADSAGDLRALYLAWLLCAQADELDGDVPEPPVPAGLYQLTAPLKAFVDFLRIDENLLAAAAERSSGTAEGSTSRRDLERWVATFAESEKSNFLVRLAAGDESQPRAELLRRFRESRPKSAPEAARTQTVAELLSAAERRSDERDRKEAVRAARKRAASKRRRSLGSAISTTLRGGSRQRGSGSDP